jgi:hypothetical protein
MLGTILWVWRVSPFNLVRTVLSFCLWSEFPSIPEESNSSQRARSRWGRMREHKSILLLSPNSGHRMGKLENEWTNGWMQIEMLIPMELRLFF